MERTDPLTVEQATVALAVAMVLLIVLSPVAAPLGMAGVALVQVFAFAAPPFGIARVIGGSARSALAALGVSTPRARCVVGALLVGASFWYLNLLTTVRASQWLFDGNEELEQLTRAMFSGSEPAWVVIAIVAVAPAVCEELLMRGALARALDARYGRAIAIVVSAAVFGLLHMSLMRLLPTATFGLVLAYATLASGSLVASVVIHLVNNAIAVALASGEFPGAIRALTSQPALVGVGAAILCGLGVFLIHTSPPAAEDMTSS